MPARWGIYLIDAIIREDRLGPLRKHGVVPEMLSGASRTALQAILDYADSPHTRGRVPTREYVKRQIPFLEDPPVGQEHGLEEICQLVRDEHLMDQVVGLCDRVREEAHRDPGRAVDIARHEFGTLDTAVSDEADDIDIIDALLPTLVKHVQTVREHGGVTGLPWPWSPLTQDTMGIHKGDLIVIYGLPKSMKTWVALYILIYVYLTSEARVLFFSPEVESIQMQLRIASLITETDYDKVKHAWLDDRDDSDLLRCLSILQDIWQKQQQADRRNQRLILTKGLLRGKKNQALDILRRKIDLYEPQLIFIDSAYYLTPSLQWEVFYEFTQQVKMLGMESQAGIILTSQENATKATIAAHAGKHIGMGSVGFGQALANDCDLLIKVTKLVRRYRNIMRHLLGLEFVAGRNLTLPGFTIHGDPGHNFKYHSNKLISLEEALRSQQPKEKTDRPVKTRGRGERPSVADRVDGEWLDD